MGNDSENWYDLPRPAAGHQAVPDSRGAAGEEPPRHRGAAARELHGAPGRRGLQRAHERRHVQRPQMSPDGQCGHALRAQRALERSVPRHRQSSDAQPATGQPRAPDPHHLSARDDPQRDRCGVDPVHGPRLVRAQERQLDAHARHPAGRRRQLARTGRCACRRRRPIHQRSPTRNGRRLTSTRTRTGGTVRTSMAAARRPRRRSVPAARARCWSARAGGSAWIRSRAGRSPDSPRTAGWD